MYKSKKGNSPFRPLLLIPIQLVLDLVLFFFGAYLDTRIVNSNAVGHPAPAFTLIFSLLAVVATVVVIIFAIVRSIVLYNKKRRSM